LVVATCWAGKIFIFPYAFRLVTQHEANLFPTSTASREYFIFEQCGFMIGPMAVMYDPVHA
jgi:hypothetical protein